jgi:phage-related protein
MAMSKNSIGDFQRTQASAANQMRIFTEGIKELATKIGNLLLPAFTAKINLLNKIMDRFQGMSEGTQKLAVKIAILAAAIGPVLVVLGSLASALGAIIGFFGAIGLTASVVIVAIGALAAAFGVFSVKTFGIKTIMNELISAFQKVKANAQEFYTLLAAGAPPIQLIIYEVAKLIGIKTQLGQALIRVRDGFNDMVAGVKTYVLQLWKSISTVFNDIKTVLEPFFEKIKAKVLPQVMGMVGEIGTLIGAIYTRISEVISFITPIWSGFWMWFKPFAEQFLNGLVNTLTFVFATVKNLFKLVRQVITGDWSGAWDTIKALLAGAVMFILNQAQNMYSGFVATISRLASNALAGLRGMKNDMVDTILNLGSSLYNAGVNAMNMLWKGLQSKLGAIKNVAAEASKAISSFLGFRSPTKEGEGKDSDKWMSNLVNMMVNDLKKNKGKLAAEAAKVSSILNFRGSSDISYNGTKEFTTPSTGKQVVLQINNAKIFDTKDIDKFMNPVVTRLRKLGVGV